MRKIYFAVAAGAVALGTVAGAAGAAHASPADSTIRAAAEAEGPGICAMLDADSSFSGIMRVAFTTIGVGHEPHEAGQVIAQAVMTQCPEYDAKLQKWAETVTS